MCVLICKCECNFLTGRAMDMHCYMIRGGRRLLGQIFGIKMIRHSRKKFVSQKLFLCDHIRQTTYVSVCLLLSEESNLCEILLEIILINILMYTLYCISIAFYCFIYIICTNISSIFNKLAVQSVECDLLNDFYHKRRRNLKLGKTVYLGKRKKLCCKI